MKNIIQIIEKYWLYAAGSIAGGLAGYLYWYYVGCLSGTCPLKSTPTVSILLGIMVGAYLSGFIQRRGTDKK